jgi:hypothetical protein
MTAIPIDIERADEEALRVLRSTAFDSVKTACKFTLGVATASGILLGALAAAHLVSVGVLIALGTVTGGTWPVAMVVLELERRSHHTRALRALVSVHRNYDLLLSQARRERDEAKADGDVLRAERGLILASANFAQLLAQAAKKQEDE